MFLTNDFPLITFKVPLSHGYGDKTNKDYHFYGIIISIKDLFYHYFYTKQNKQRPLLFSSNIF